MINNKFEKQLKLTDSAVLLIRQALSTTNASIVLQIIIRNNVVLSLHQLKIISNSLLDYSNDPNLSEEEKQELIRLSGYVLWS